MIRFTVITPTCGRPTLSRTLASIPVDPEIEVLVVGDGPQPEARRMFDEAERNDLWRYWETEPTNSYGNYQRDEATLQAQGRRLGFMDDDDVYTPTAWDSIKRLDTEYPEYILIFRMVYGSLEDRGIWERPQFAIGNVGGTMFMPLRSPVSKWAEDHSAISDLGYMLRTCELQRPPNSTTPPIVWSRDVIAIVRPE